ncbi:receptor-like protein EIX1 [Aristolochia californica]|uniref:receptor-like protein EIX1 n=1 Tax=Aristolochia californica TaxID=171875 RepID=UPI0035DC8B14
MSNFLYVFSVALKGFVGILVYLVGHAIYVVISFTGPQSPLKVFTMHFNIRLVQSSFGHLQTIQPLTCQVVNALGEGERRGQDERRIKHRENRVSVQDMEVTSIVNSFVALMVHHSQCWIIAVSLRRIDVGLLQLKHLRHLDLSGYSFHGVQIPDFFQFLKEVEAFELVDRTRSPRVCMQIILTRCCPPTPSFLNLTQLSYLDLSSNDFYGDVSSEFGTLPHLEEFYLWYNYNLKVNFSNLFGGSWKNIKAMRKSNHKGLSKLNGKLSQPPNSVLRLVMLLKKFNPVIPHGQFLHAWENSRLWNMNNNSGSPPYITLATNSYTYIDLSYNKFTGPISFLTNPVYFLDISYNQFSGVIPPLLGKMKELEILNLSHNNLTGGVLPTLANCGSLNVLDLKANHLSNNIPWSSIHGNEFSGSLPSWIGVTLSNLQILQLRGTYYKERVDVSMNGFVYEYTTNFSLVIVLDLSNNNLSGTIPEEVTDLIGLIVLNLSRNRFFGKLPQSIGRLQQSINLDLSRNRLFGLILAAIASLTFLSYLNLSYNNLSRIIPSSNQVDTLND